jgi:hypothetical protein
MTARSSRSSSSSSRFPIPSSLHDLERAPYHLLPYPVHFDDCNDDEAARAASFLELVTLLEQGNRTLLAMSSEQRGVASSSTLGLLQELPIDTEECTDDINDMDNMDNNLLWMDEDRMQALYTLVRYVFYIPACVSRHTYPSITFAEGTWTNRLELYHRISLLLRLLLLSFICQQIRVAGTIDAPASRRGTGCGHSRTR